MVYAQVAHALSLNEVCGALRLQSGPLSAIRGARPPAKNTLSHANKVRDAGLSGSSRRWARPGSVACV
jgi:hypothetical protein